MPYIIWEGARAKNSGLIHVVPDPGDTKFYEFFVKPSPPFPHLRIGKIRKLAASGPYMTFHIIIVTATAEIIVLFTFLKDPVIVVYLYARIYHDNRFKTNGRQVTDHLLRVRKVLFIPGKATVAIHIIDVEV